MTDQEALTAIRTEVKNYHFALDMRQHGGTACAAAMERIQQVLGMPWVSGRELADRKGVKNDARRQGEEGVKKVSR